MKPLWTSILIILLSWGLSSCSSDRLETPQISFSEQTATPVVVGKLSEVPPPKVIQELRQSLDQYQPQVKILSPQAEQVFQDTNVTVKLEVKDLPIFKDQDLEMGPHLHLILDNEPYKPIYDVYNPEKPIILNNLTPGSHTIRVFASRPWHESFKNDGAYAQTTFHIFTKTEEHTPSPSLPLLTYSRPQGNYGAEPILVDFYLTNAPLHVVAQENPSDEIADWRIRVTVNGESFLMDNWQPIYLKGFEKGNNWVKLEFIDEEGNPINNAFNNTVRLIAYNPKGQDTLSKLVRGELSATVARSIVDPNYSAKLTPTPEPIVTPTPTPTPIVKEKPLVAPEIPTETAIPTPSPIESPTVVEPEIVQPSSTVSPTALEKPVTEPETTTEAIQPSPSLTPTAEETAIKPS